MLVIDNGNSMHYALNFIGLESWKVSHPLEEINNLKISLV